MWLMFYTFHSISTAELSGKIIICIRQLRLRQRGSLSEVVQRTCRNSWIYAEAAFCQSLSATHYCLGMDKLNIKFHKM